MKTDAKTIESSTHPTSNVSTIKKQLVKSLFWDNKLSLFGGLFFYVLLFSTTVFSPYIASSIVNAAVAQSVGDIFFFIFLDILMTIVIILIRLTTRRLVPKFIYQACTNYRNTAFKYLLNKKISTFEGGGGSDYVSAFTNDIYSIESSYLEKLFLLAGKSVAFVIALVILFVQSIPLAIVAILSSIVPLLVSITRLGDKLAADQKKASDSASTFVAQISDLIKGFPLIKSFDAGASALRLFDLDNKHLEEAKQHYRRSDRLISLVSVAAFDISQGAVLGFGAYLCATNQGVTPGGIFMAALLMGYIGLPMEEVPPVIAARKASYKLIDKLARLLAEEADEEGTASLSPVEKAISLDRITFGYEKNTPVLKNLTVTFEAKKSYAIVGTSGSGKSTLLSLLMGGYPSYTGSIFYDSLELKDISRKSLYQNVSLVQQENFLFNASIKDNVTMFGDYPEDAIMDACNRAGLAEFIEKNGLDYHCGEGGSSLSGGERQRVCIARSLLRGTDVLLLDEATSALDHATADQIISSIANLTDTTRIVITHNLEEAQLTKFDEILVMKDGRLVEKGTFDELIAHDEYFKALYTLEQ